mmetsp:Transcript_17433/g.52657  ORF Transcript_17433/g.52657 Transcript_17433/m.52657 type:complete len:416 (+) Transcript_17433:550-1797(+)
MQGGDDVVLRAELQGHGDVVHAIVLLALHQALHHLTHVRSYDARDDGRRADEAVGELHLLDLLLEDSPDELLEVLLLWDRQLPLLLLLLLLQGIQVQLKVLVGRVHGHKLLVLKALDAIDHVLIDLLVHKDDIPVALDELLHVGRRHARLPVRAREVVDVFLAILRSGYIFFHGHELTLALLGALEAEELQDVVLVAAEVALLVLDNACLQVVGVALEELGVLLGVLLCLLVQEAQDPPGDGHAELLHEPGVLHVLAADIHRHVLAVDNALHPVQPLRDHAVGVLLHEHASGVEGHAYLRIAREDAAWGIVRVRHVEAALDRQRSIRLVHQRVVWLTVGRPIEVAEELRMLLGRRRALLPESFLLVDGLFLPVLDHVDGEVNKGRKLLGGLFDRRHLGKLCGIVLEDQLYLRAAG